MQQKCYCYKCNVYYCLGMYDGDRCTENSTFQKHVYPWHLLLLALDRINCV